MNTQETMKETMNLFKRYSHDMETYYKHMIEYLKEKGLHGDTTHIFTRKDIEYLVTNVLQRSYDGKAYEQHDLAVEYTEYGLRNAVWRIYDYFADNNIPFTQANIEAELYKIAYPIMPDMKDFTYFFDNGDYIDMYEGNDYHFDTQLERESVRSRDYKRNAVEEERTEKSPDYARPISDIISEGEEEMEEEEEMER